MVATNHRFKGSLCKVVGCFAELVAGRVDENYLEALKDIERSATDSPPARSWVETLRKITDAISIGNVVPSSSIVGHLRADAPGVDRLFELLIWEGVGAIAATRPDLNFRLPNPPSNLPIGLNGAFHIPEFALTDKIWTLTSRGRLLLQGPGVEYAALSGELGWKANIPIQGKYIHACIPINSASMMNRDLQEFPMIRSEVHASTWVPVLINSTEIIGKYSERASECISELIQCVIPLVGGDSVIGSASCEDTLGLVFLPGCTSVDQIAECLLHETMHQYLYRLEDCGGLFRGDSEDAELFYSPWREDPRPLRMALHGAFVFAAVADFYSWGDAPTYLNLEAKECAFRSYYRCRQATLALNTVLRHSIFSERGKTVVSELQKDLSDIVMRSTLLPTERMEIENRIIEHRERHAEYIS